MWLWFERFLLGRISPSDRLKVLAVAGTFVALIPSLGQGVLFVPIILVTLAWGKWATGLFVLLLSFSNLGGGVAPIVVGLLSAAFVEGFRNLCWRERELAQERQGVLKTLVHELRNPLFAAKGTIDNLSARFTDLEPAQMERQLAMASAAMQSINQEVDDLTQLLRFESGGLVARPGWLMFEDLFQSLRSRYPKERLPHHDLVLQGEGAVGVCDGLLLLQALDKLIGNAVAHSPGGRITVSGIRQADGCRIEVKDEGPGIAESARQTVFERFTQLHQNDHSGFGLGLFLAKQYIVVQKGKLTLEDSETGCLFRIWLPGDWEID